VITVLYLLAIILPPVAVLAAGKPGQAFLNIFLTILGWFPGMIHALLVVSSHQADGRTGKMMKQSEIQHQQTLQLMHQQAVVEAARLGIAPPPPPHQAQQPAQPAPSTGPTDYQTVIYCVGGLLVLAMAVVYIIM
jgi:uncharacterized membrane protein YqaE (UPF0057 family)